MAQLDAAFKDTLSLQPPLPPGYLERLLSHLGDEVIANSGERYCSHASVTHPNLPLIFFAVLFSTIRLFALSSDIQHSILDWLHGLAHVLPQRATLDFVSQADAFSRQNSITLSFWGQFLLEEIYAAAGGVAPAVPGTLALAHAWASSPAGDALLKRNYDINANDPAFLEFQQLLADGPRRRSSDMMDLDEDDIIIADDDTWLEPADRRVSPSEAMKVCVPLLSRPFGTTSPKTWGLSPQSLHLSFSG